MKQIVTESRNTENAAGARRYGCAPAAFSVRILHGGISRNGIAEKITGQI
ncbi:MAG: hypothetical protein K6C08_01300 [Oscillospiraceae bacterium]|nr:hypothetical protein [Oscillospiraceae bacterium]